jgi:hypothetical protein
MPRSLICLLFALFATGTGLPACDGGGRDAGPDGGPDADTDTDTDTDSDTDSDSDGDLCESYPEADNAFQAGDVVRNYTLIDTDESQVQICELADGEAQLLFISISATTCETCASEIGDLADLQTEYDGQIVVVEVMQDVDDWSQIAETPWADASGYLLARTEPADLVETDYGSNQSFLGYPTTPLIDMQTMQVLDDDCWTAAQWHDCIAEFL